MPPTQSDEGLRAALAARSELPGLLYLLRDGMVRLRTD